MIIKDKESNIMHPKFLEESGNKEIQDHHVKKFTELRINNDPVGIRWESQVKSEKDPTFISKDAQEIDRVILTAAGSTIRWITANPATEIRNPTGTENICNETEVSSSLIGN